MLEKGATTLRTLVTDPAKLAEVLTKELLTFKVKITTAGNETFEAWRERDHDDLVLALAVALWYAERDLDDGDDPILGLAVGGRNTP